MKIENTNVSKQNKANLIRLIPFTFARREGVVDAKADLQTQRANT